MRFPLSRMVADLCPLSGVKQAAELSDARQLMTQSGHEWLRRFGWWRRIAPAAIWAVC